MAEKSAAIRASFYDAHYADLDWHLVPFARYNDEQVGAFMGVDANVSRHFRKTMASRKDAMDGTFHRVRRRRWENLPLGQIYDSTIAFVFQSTIPKVLRERYCRGILQFELQYPFHVFDDEDECKMYGKTPDSYIAKLFSTTRDTIVARRRQRGIDSFYASEIEKFLNRFAWLLDTEEELQVYGHVPSTHQIDWHLLDYTKPVAELAKELNVEPGTIHRNRNFAKTQAANLWRRSKENHRDYWLSSTRTDRYAMDQKAKYNVAESFDLDNVTLGLCSDSVVAKWCQTHFGNVKSRRQSMGILKFDDPSHFVSLLEGVSNETPEDELPLGLIFDEPLALHLGCSRRTIAKLRKRKGIQGFYETALQRFLEDARARRGRK